MISEMSDKFWTPYPTALRESVAPAFLPVFPLLCQQGML